jgi:hypothetical protein
MGVAGVGLWMMGVVVLVFWRRGVVVCVSRRIACSSPSSVTRRGILCLFFKNRFAQFRLKMILKTTSKSATGSSIYYMVASTVHHGKLARRSR